jgi:hypothetical protein
MAADHFETFAIEQGLAAIALDPLLLCELLE